MKHEINDPVAPNSNSAPEPLGGSVSKPTYARLRHFELNSASPCSNREIDFVDGFDLKSRALRVLRIDQRPFCALPFLKQRDRGTEERHFELNSASPCSNREIDFVAGFDLKSRALRVLRIDQRPFCALPFLKQRDRGTEKLSLENGELKIKASRIKSNPLSRVINVNQFNPRHQCSIPSGSSVSLASEFVSAGQPDLTWSSKPPTQLQLDRSVSGALDFKQRFGAKVSPQMCWLKSKRPANSLPNSSLSWPLELQRDVSLASAGRSTDFSRCMPTPKSLSLCPSVLKKKNSRASSQPVKKHPQPGTLSQIWPAGLHLPLRNERPDLTQSTSRNIYLRLLSLLLILLSFASLSAQSFGQNKVNAVDSKWSMIRSMHFDVYFPAGNDDFGRLATLMAEETYYALKEDLRFPLSSRVPLIIYGTKTEFQGTNIIYPLLTEGIGGFTESLRNRVVIPFEGSYTKLEELMVHELTHAYNNAMDSNSSLMSSLRPASFPFWFSEGLPEFLSIGGEDDFNNMFILDMVVNDNLPPLEYSDGYLAYRLGESFLSYIAQIWGREKVSDYYFALRSARSVDEATKKVFGMDLEELESRWRYHLKRLHYPAVNLYGTPKEDMEQRTFSSKDGSYFNYMPRFSPDGKQYVYFSNQGARYSIWMGGTHGLSKPSKLITGEATRQMEEFYYFRANLSWFPDSRRVAFGAKNSTGDVIHILDTQREKIVQTITIPELQGIYELDVSPDGKRIVLSGQQGMRSDIFIYDIATQELERLTDDLFWDAQPRWNPDGSSVVFASERILDPNGTRRGFFANYRSGIFKLDLDTRRLWQMSDEPNNCSYPMWDFKSGRLLYVTSDEGVANFRILDPEAGTKANVTKVLAGIYAGDISADGRNLLVSNFFNGAWNIYFSYNPLDSLQYRPAAKPLLHQASGDMWDHVDLSQLDLYGRRPRTRPKRINPAAQYDARRPLLGEEPVFEYTRQDSLLFFRDYSYDDRPTQPGSKLPTVEKSRSGFAIEHLWGGLAYSSSAGAIGYVELGLADMMGNHGIGLNAGFSGILEENDILLSYLYLKKRSDFGIGIYNQFDVMRITRYEQPGPDFYTRDVERNTGVYLLWRYPFSRFLRIEFDQMLHRRKTRLDYWGWNAEASDGEWIQLTEPEYDWVVAPGLTLVHDNALFGSTGPLVGWRAMGTLRSSFTGGRMDYLAAYLDWRGYRLFNRRYGLASRLVGGMSSGDRAPYFSLNDLYGVRGYDEDTYGRKKLMASAELRFPFFDYIAMAFPVPLTIPNIRGSVFADLGTVFDNLKDFQPVQDNKLHDLKLGYGFGPRLNLGYVVLRLDIAWASDLSRISKPAYYLSLSEDF